MTESTRNPHDRGADIAAAKLDQITSPPKLFAWLRQLLMRWLGVVDVARVVNVIALNQSRAHDESELARDREIKNTGALKSLIDQSEQVRQLVLQAVDRLAYYEQHVPHMKRARTDYDKLVSALRESREGPPTHHGNLQEVGTDMM